MIESSPRIGLWGWYNSGKTSYLVALYRDLGIHNKGWRMYPRDIDSEKFIEMRAKELMPGGYLIGSSDLIELEERSVEYGFELVANDRLKPRDYLLTLVDGKGRFTKSPNDVSGYFGELQKCDGIICLIDPEIDASGLLPKPAQFEPGDPPESYFELLERLFRKLAMGNLTEKRCLRPHIAFCVNKIDLDEPWQAIKDPARNQIGMNPIKDYCHRIIGNQATQLIQIHCDPRRINYFALSAVGRYDAPAVDAHGRPTTINRSNYEPAGDRYRIAALDKWNPIGLMEPLKWLFDRIDDEAHGGRVRNFARGLRPRWLQRNGTR